MKMEKGMREMDNKTEISRRNKIFLKIGISTFCYMIYNNSLNISYNLISNFLVNI